VLKEAGVEEDGSLEKAREPNGGEKGDDEEPPMKTSGASSGECTAGRPLWKPEALRGTSG